jgi:hypothetical protein
MDAADHLSRVLDAAAIQSEHLDRDDWEVIRAGVEMVKLTHDATTAREILDEMRAREAFYAALGNLWEALLRAGRERDGEVSEAASAEIGSVLATYRSEVEELADVRRELSTAREDVENLPGESYRGSMDGDSLLEEELRGKYLLAKSKIPDLEEREARLRGLLDGQVRGAWRRLCARTP